MTTTNSSSATPSPVSGPGAQLAQARADLRWSREDVATKLHLSSRQIQAMEEDDYANLPGSTYVRGYLKSYALLLGLSPATILEAHARLTAKPAQQDFSNIAPQREITSRHHQVRFTTYLVAAIVVGLAIAWWVGRETRTPVPVVATAPVAPATDVEPMPESETAATPTPTPVTATPPPAASPATPPPTAPAKPAAPVAAPTTPPAAVSPVVAAPAAPAAPKPLPATGPRARLVLYADQDTWADIRDARQIKLLYETVPAGRAVTLEGVAPVSVFLGNASGTRIEYNGKPVNIVKHQRGMVARFTLGEEAAAVAPAP